MTYHAPRRRAHRCASARASRGASKERPAPPSATHASARIDARLASPAPYRRFRDIRVNRIRTVVFLALVASLATAPAPLSARIVTPPLAGALVRGVARVGGPDAAAARTLARSGDARRVPGDAWRDAPRPPRRLNRFQRRRLAAMLAGRAAAGSDTLRLIALQVEFADTLMGGSPGAERRALRDRTWFANELRHVAEYFDGASRGRLVVAWTLDTLVVRLARPMLYYGNDRFEDRRVVELVEELVDSVDARVDFSRYDHVFVIHAGAGQETDLAGDSRDQIWSSFYDAADVDAARPDSLAGGIVTEDSLAGRPVRIRDFSIVPASPSQDFATVGSLGIWVFQLGVRLGLVPLFDSTPPGAPDSQGVGAFDVMAYGLFDANGFVPSFPCAFNRVLAGWLDPVTIDPGPAPRTVRLVDVNTAAPGDTACVRVPVTGAEYWLVVNRVHDADFDSLFTFADADSDLVPDNAESLAGAEFDFFLTDLTNPFVTRFDARYGTTVLRRHTGSGAYVWHVDEAVVREAVRSGFLPDDFVARKGVDLEEADGVEDLDRPGPPAFSLGSHWDAFRAGNADRFGPDTTPDTRSAGGAPTGVVMEAFSAAGHAMTFVLRRDGGFVRARRRWAGDASGQPPTPADLDGDGTAEIVVLGDSATVWAFDATGGEYVDADGDPATIAPWLRAPERAWAGWPAAADLDGVAGDEIVAAARDGSVYAWRGDGTELADGDGDPGTTGVLAAVRAAAPPVLVDVTGDGRPEVVVVARAGDSLAVSFVDAAGGDVVPADPPLAPHWPRRVPGQYAAPPVVAHVAPAGLPTLGAVALLAGDTTDATVRLVVAPAWGVAGPVATGDAPGWTRAFAVPPGWTAATYVAGALAAGDVDADGDDEVVVVTPDGVVRIADGATGERITATLRAAHPSAPALGDVDGDGTLEIALWDDAWRYVLASNGRVLTGWPRRIVPRWIDAVPPLRPARARTSPVILDVDGDGTLDVVFPTDDGTTVARNARGDASDGFPRTIPAAPATPTVVSPDGVAAPRLWAVGSTPGLTVPDAVVDTVGSAPRTELAIQDLVGATAGFAGAWPMAAADAARTGRASATAPRASSPAVAASTFMVYPNPVFGAEVHARVVLGASADVTVTVYTMEGQRALRRRWRANASGAPDTPFDEALDVSNLASGVYFMRVHIVTAGGSTTLVRPFAIRR